MWHEHMGQGAVVHPREGDPAEESRERRVHSTDQAGWERPEVMYTGLYQKFVADGVAVQADDEPEGVGARVPVVVVGGSAH